MYLAGVTASIYVTVSDSFRSVAPVADRDRRTSMEHQHVTRRLNRRAFDVRPDEKRASLDPKCQGRCRHHVTMFETCSLNTVAEQAL